MSESQPPSGSTPTPENKADTGFQPGDDTFTHWRNIFAILMGRMTDEGKEQFRVARDLRNETEDCKRCETQRDYLFQYSEFAALSRRQSPQQAG
jgi:inner membrane protease ATP23